MADEMVSWSLQSYRPENRRVRHGTGHNADNAEATAEKAHAWHCNNHLYILHVLVKAIYV